MLSVRLAARVNRLTAAPAPVPVAGRVRTIEGTPAAGDLIAAATRPRTSGRGGPCVDKGPGASCSAPPC